MVPIQAISFITTRGCSVGGGATGIEVEEDVSPLIGKDDTGTDGESGGVGVCVGVGIVIDEGVGIGDGVRDSLGNGETGMEVGTFETIVRTGLGEGDIIELILVTLVMEGDMIGVIGDIIGDTDISLLSPIMSPSTFCVFSSCQRMLVEIAAITNKRMVTFKYIVQFFIQFLYLPAWLDTVPS